MQLNLGIVMRDFSSGFIFSIQLLHHCPIDPDKDHSLSLSFFYCLPVGLKVFMFSFQYQIAARNSSSRQPWKEFGCSK